MTTPTWPTILDGARYADGRAVQPHTLKAIGEIVESASRHPRRWYCFDEYPQIRTEIRMEEGFEPCCPVGAAYHSPRLSLPDGLEGIGMPRVADVDQWPHPWGRAARIVIQASDAHDLEVSEDGIRRRTRALLERRLVHRIVEPELLPRLP